MYMNVFGWCVVGAWPQVAYFVILLLLCPGAPDDVRAALNLLYLSTVTLCSLLLSINWSKRILKPEAWVKSESVRLLRCLVSFRHKVDADTYVL